MKKNYLLFIAGILLLLLFASCFGYKVNITPGSAEVDRGSTIQFSANISGGTNESPPIQGVTWEVTGGSHGTSISSSGRLTVSISEMAETLTVKAKSIHHSVSSTVTVRINNPLGVTHVTVSPNTVNIIRGGTAQFSSVVHGFGNHSQNVIWSVIGGNTGTIINNTGFLTVDNEETARNLIVKATSIHGNTISGQAIATIENTIYIRDVNDVEDWIAVMRDIWEWGNDRYFQINLNGDILLPVPTGNNFGLARRVVVTIQGNGALNLSANGALIQLGDEQTLIVKNISLIGRASNNSSLVVVNSGSVFIMEENATLTGNHTSGTAGGVLVRSDGEFILDSSSIVNNTSSGSVGGVYVEGGNFLMRGEASIRGNNFTGWNGVGGVVVASDGVFTMENGSITGNNSPRSVGGVHVAERGIFVMLNGSIASNIASNGNGGGVYVSSSSSNWGTFILQNGIISGNTARDGRGGGIYFERNAFFVKYQGTITGSDTPAPLGNTATIQGDAVFRAGSPDKWRNRTAGPNDRYDEFFYEP